MYCKPDRTSRENTKMTTETEEGRKTDNNDQNKSFGIYWSSFPVYLYDIRRQLILIKRGRSLEDDIHNRKDLCYCKTCLFHLKLRILNDLIG